MSGVTPQRVLAVAGVAGLLLAAVTSVLLITGAAGGDDQSPDGEGRAAATPQATPEATPEPEPTPEPLTEEERAARRAAAETVRSQGYEVVRLRHYDPDRTLRVLIGRNDAGERMAFFFVRDDYIGTDSVEPSARLRVLEQRERQVTLGYGIYAPDDEACCPSGGPVEVRYRWDGSALAPRDPQPPPQQRTPAYHVP